MKLEIPFYFKINDVYKIARDKNGEQELITFELSDYVVRIQDLENVKELTEEFNKPSHYVDFVNTIKTSDLLPSFQEKKDKFKKDWERTIEGVPQHIIDKLKQNRIEFEKLLATELKQSMLFLKEHITDIENLFRVMIEEQKNKMKQSRKEAQHKYYLKKKQELNVSFDPQPEKVELTEEEIIEKKRQSRKNACKKYYLKMKQELKVSFDPESEKVELTEEETIEKKRQARKECNKKYYLKVKHQLQTAIDIPEEKSVIDLKEKKKQYNKKYYQSKKDKLLQLSKNENEQLDLI
jgi:hypothetical protein